MISSKNVNQYMLKIPYCFEKIIKSPQALEVPPPDPSWPPAAGGSAPDPLPRAILPTPTVLLAILPTPTVLLQNVLSLSPF